MWKHSEARSNGIQPDLGGSTQSIGMEECPNCHQSAQPGRFCTYCGTKLSNKFMQPTPGSSRELGSQDLVHEDNDGWPGGSMKPGIGGFNEPSGLHLGSRSALGGRRFSQGIGDDDLPIGSGSSGLDYMQLSSPTNSLNPPLLSRVNAPMRRRASTSSNIMFGHSMLGDDNSFYGESTFDDGLFDTSQDPLFPSHPHPYSMDPLDPLSGQTSMGLESSLRSPPQAVRGPVRSLGQSFMPFGSSSSNTFGLGPKFGLAGESLDDMTLGSRPPPFRPSRSRSEIDIAMLPDPDDSLFVNEFEAGVGAGLRRPFGNGGHDMMDSIRPIRKPSAMPTLSRPYSISPVDDTIPFPTDSVPGSGGGNINAMATSIATAKMDNSANLSVNSNYENENDTMTATSSRNGGNYPIRRVNSDFIFNSNADLSTSTPSTSTSTTNSKNDKNDKNDNINTFTVGNSTMAMPSNVSSSSITTATTTTPTKIAQPPTPGSFHRRPSKLSESDLFSTSLSVGSASTTHSPLSGRSVSPTKGITSMTEGITAMMSTSNTGNTGNTGNAGRRGGSVPPLSANVAVKLFEGADAKKWSEFSNYRGRLVDNVCTQSGSKALQNLLNSAMSDKVRTSIIDSMITEITPTGSRIICDTFGNYFYQLLFQKSSSSQKETLLRALLHGEQGSTAYEISVNKTGTFAFQNIIDYMRESRVLGGMIVSALQESVVNGKVEDVTLRLIKENKGTHIVQRIMKTFEVDQWSSIYQILLSNCYSVAMDRNGSMVLRLCYDLVDIDRKAQIADDIIAHARELAVDPVGNYVVQHVLSIPEGVSEEQRSRYESFINGVLVNLQGHYVELSKQKYSSNVVEKSITNSLLLRNHAIFDELLSISAVLQLLENHFGTYVLQKILQSINRDRLRELDGDIRNCRQMTGSHGSNLINRWKQILNKVQQ